MLWRDELKRLGWSGMLRSRPAFHGELRLKDVAANTGCSEQTAMKHLRREVESGHARWLKKDGEPVGIIPPQ